VLLECAFLDNPKDKEALIDPAYRKKLMQAVVDGVTAYVEAM
jgi:N-acetylmuramoyl-L-alanine amidase